MEETMSARMYITKVDGANFPQPFCVEKNGVILSVGGDDNCGIAKNFERLDVAFFRGENGQERYADHPLVKKYGSHGSISVWHDPELLVKVISEFLSD